MKHLGHFIRNEKLFSQKVSSLYSMRAIESFQERVNEENKNMCIAYNYAANGDIFQYAQYGLSEPVQRFYFQQIIRNVSEMHKANVCHRDLKLENLVLEADFNLKIIDFGMACDISGSDGSGFCSGVEKVGTKSYMSPEVMLQIDYQPIVADLFALGVIIFSLHTRCLPFLEASINDPYYKLFIMNKQDQYWNTQNC